MKIVIDEVLKLISHTDSLVVIKSTITPDVINQIYNSIHLRKFTTNNLQSRVSNRELSKKSLLSFHRLILGGVTKETL